MSQELLQQIVSVVGIALTIIAFLIALWQTRIALAQIQDSRSQARALEAISDALSTNYVGSYPDYVWRIGAVLREAQHHIRILCTVPMHGVFNNPQAWLETKQAVETFLDAPPSAHQVTCVFSSQRQQWALQENQYKHLKSSWPDWMNEPDNAAKMRRLFDRFRSDGHPLPITFDNFMILLDRASRVELETTFARAKVFHVEVAPPLFLWIADDAHAIFVLKAAFPDFSAQAFVTSDARIITALIDIHESYARSAPGDLGEEP